MLCHFSRFDHSLKCWNYFRPIKRLLIYNSCPRTVVFCQNIGAKSKFHVKIVGAEILCSWKISYLDTLKGPGQLGFWQSANRRLSMRSKKFDILGLMWDNFADNFDWAQNLFSPRNNIDRNIWMMFFTLFQEVLRIDQYHKGPVASYFIWWHVNTFTADSKWPIVLQKIFCIALKNLFWVYFRNNCLCVVGIQWNLLERQRSLLEKTQMPPIIHLQWQHYRRLKYGRGYFHIILSRCWFADFMFMWHV